MRRRVFFVIAFVIVMVGLILLLLNLYHTAGDYWARVYYEKTERGYVLKGVEIYAKPIRPSGYYRVELYHPELEPSELVYRDRSYVRIIVDEVRIYAKDTILLRPNTEVQKYIDLNNCLIVKEPVKFQVYLSPVRGCFVINIFNVNVIIES